jgi:hypothetical protein
MGTNFYLRKKLSAQEKELAKQYIDKDKHDELKQLIPEDIHIGKRSGGWKFLWDAHFFEYFEPTKESLLDWLHSGQIIDEYGEEFTFEQFWNDEISGFLNKGYDLESYYKTYPKEHQYWDFKSGIDYFDRRCPNFEGDINKYGEFYIDDLRFSISEDFG